MLQNGRKIRINIANVFAVILSVSTVTGEQGFVTDNFMDNKLSCSNIKKKIVTEESEMQCLHRCMRIEKCDVINYKVMKDGKPVHGNCELAFRNDCSALISSLNWKAAFLKRRKKKKEHKSCKEIYAENEDLPTGVYALKSGQHFCSMDNIPGCGGGGWTLALKVDGSKTTFSPNAALWKNDVVYNIKEGMTSFYENEAKFPAFSKVSFENVCFGMKVSGDVRWLRIKINRPSLLEVFQSDEYLNIALGRQAWKGLISGSSLQRNCNRQGINVKDDNNAIRTRIGMIANNEDHECRSPDSFIGIGGSWRSCGNVASIYVDNGTKDTIAMCYLLVK